MLQVIVSIAWYSSLAGLPAQTRRPAGRYRSERCWRITLRYKRWNGLPGHATRACYPHRSPVLPGPNTPVAGSPGSGWCSDWKTQRKKPSLSSQKNRLQTRLYPFLMVMAGERLNGGQPLQPEQVELIYWFTEFPTEPQRIPYSASQYEADRRDLAGLITTLSQQQPGEFPLTPRRERCAFFN